MGRRILSTLRGIGILRGIRIATASVRAGFAMTVFYKGCGAYPAGGVEPRPYGNVGMLA